MLRKVLVALAVVLVLGLLLARYELGSEAVPATTRYALDLEAVRALARSTPGPLPVAVNEELVAEASLPAAAVFAGASFAPHPMVHRVFQLLFPDGSFVLVDAAMGREMAREMGGDEGFHDAAYAAVMDALPRARLVVFTHEHQDHIDGVARYPEPEKLVGIVRLSAAQLANTAALDAVAMPQVLRAGPPLAVAPYLAVAPGVVLIRAAGHTPGSQLVYVALADGHELLLIGDVAWHWRAIEQGIYRPRLVTDWVLGEDREAVLDQFRRLKDLAREEPGLTIVVSHDADQRRRLLDEGRIGEHFAPGI